MNVLFTDELVVMTQSTLSVYNIVTGQGSDTLHIPGCAWGMVFNGVDELLVGTSLSGSGVGQEECFFLIAKRTKHGFGPEDPAPSGFARVWESSVQRGNLEIP